MPDVTRKRWNFGFSVVRPFRIELQAMKKKADEERKGHADRKEEGIKEREKRKAEG